MDAWGGRSGQRSRKGVTQREPPSIDRLALMPSRAGPKPTNLLSEAASYATDGTMLPIMTAAYRLAIAFVMICKITPSESSRSPNG